MSRKCEITGRGPTIGHSVSHAHNVTLRRWNVNLQKVRVLIDGRPMRIRVSTKAIKSGLIVRPPVVSKQRRRKEIRPQMGEAAGIVKADEPVDSFFSDASVVGRLFKPKPKPTESEPIPGVDIPAFDAPGPVFEELDAPRKARKQPE